MTVDWQTLLLYAAFFALSVGFAFGLIHLARWLFTEKQGYPHEEKIEAVLKDAAYQAIVWAFKGADWSYDKAGVILRGLYRADLAKDYYPKLPETVRRLVTQEEFEDIVKDTYDALVQGWQTLDEYMVDKWAKRLQDLKDTLSTPLVDT